MLSLDRGGGGRWRRVLEFPRLTVEDLAVLQLANVAHLDAVALLGGLALALLLVVDGDAADVAGALCGGGSGLCGFLLLVNPGRASGAHLEVLGELYLLLVAAGGLSLLSLDSLLGGGLLGGGNGLAVVLLDLLGGLGVAVGRGLAHQVVEALGLGGGALVLVLALLLLDELGNFLLRVDLGDAGVLEAVELVILGLVHLVDVELVIAREVVVLLILLVVVLVILVVLLREGNVVTGDENVVCAVDLEVDLLALADGDVEGLLVVLRSVSWLDSSIAGD